MRQFTYNLNKLIPSSEAKPLTILGEMTDKNTLTEQQKKELRYIFITRDFSKDNSATKQEYSIEEIINFQAIQNKIKQIAKRCNKTEEEIETLLMTHDCNWDIKEQRFKTKKVGDQIISALIT